MAHTVYCSYQRRTARPLSALAAVLDLHTRVLARSAVRRRFLRHARPRPTRRQRSLHDPDVFPRRHWTRRCNEVIHGAPIPRGDDAPSFSRRALRLTSSTKSTAALRRLQADLTFIVAPPAAPQRHPSRHVAQSRPHPDATSIIPQGEERRGDGGRTPPQQAVLVAAGNGEGRRSQRSAVSRAPLDEDSHVDNGASTSRDATTPVLYAR